MSPVVYWTATGAVLLIFVGSVVLTFGDLGATRAQTAGLGYPVFTAVPLGVAKVLGLVAILSRRSRLLTGLAFAGFFYDTLLALSAPGAARAGQRRAGRDRDARDGGGLRRPPAAVRSGATRVTPC